MWILNSCERQRPFRSFVTAIWECCGIFSALFNCDSEFYHKFTFCSKVVSMCLFTGFFEHMSSVKSLTPWTKTKTPWTKPKTPCTKTKTLWTASSLLFFFAKLLHAKPKHASVLGAYREKRGIASWFAIALDKIKN